MALTINHNAESIAASTQILTIDNTGAIVVSKGSTANRPGTAQTGMLRFNTDIDSLEVYKNIGGWTDLTDAAAPATDEAIAFAIVFGG